MSKNIDNIKMPIKLGESMHNNGFTNSGIYNSIIHQFKPGFKHLLVLYHGGYLKKEPQQLIDDIASDIEQRILEASNNEQRNPKTTQE